MLDAVRRGESRDSGMPKRRKYGVLPWTELYQPGWLLSKTQNNGVDSEQCYRVVDSEFVLNKLCCCHIADSHKYPY